MITEAPITATTAGPEVRPARSTPPSPEQRRVKALVRFAVSISALTLVGHLVLGFEPAWRQLVVTVIAAYGFELTFETIEARLQGRAVRFGGGPRALMIFLLPAHIAAFSLSLLIYPGQHLVVCVFAAAVAVGSKHLFKAPVRGRSRHFMNPSNFAIVVVLTGYAYMGPAPSYMFTELVSGVWDVVVPVVLLISGLLLNIKLTGRGWLILAWVVGVAAQAVIKGTLWPDQFSTLGSLAFMTGATFVLFTNYMITDPGSTPFARRGQVVFGLTAAAAYGVLSGVGITYGLFYAVVVTCLLRGLGLWLIHLRSRLAVPTTVDHEGVRP